MVCTCVCDQPGTDHSLYSAGGSVCGGAQKEVDHDLDRPRKSGMRCHHRDTVVLATFATWMSNYMSIEFIKKVDESYLARCSGILNSASMASTPIISFLVSGVVGFTGTKEIFMGTGILAVAICGIMLRSPQLDEEPAAELA